MNINNSLYINVIRKISLLIIVNLIGFIETTNSSKNVCESNPCKNSGTCTNENGKLMCRCPSGFIGANCQFVDPCSPSQCQNGGSCIIFFINETTPPLFNCSCPIGFTASLCEVPVSNVCDNFPCKNGGTCKLSSSLEEFTCLCPSGFKGDTCEIAASCPNGQEDCSHNNNNNNNNKNDSKNICDSTANVCKNGGRCTTTGVGPGPNNSFTCECPKNWKGPQCTQDVDECAENPNICQNGGTCSNFIGGFRCICVNGWEGEFCEINHDDCVGTKCYNGGTCHDRVASFYCECSAGYTGLLCHLRNACMSSPCHQSAICDTSPVDGSYVCSCPQGYRGVDCSEDVDECALGNPCEHAGTCWNTPGSYKCLCPAGWAGLFCDQNINECASNPCHNDATCLDDVGKFICVCMPGFSGEFCEINIDDCSSLPCLNGGICVDGTNNYTCHCTNGFYGRNCENSSIKPKLCDAQPCKNKGECIELSGHYLCRCTDGFYGVHCERSATEKLNTTTTSTTTFAPTTKQIVIPTTADYRHELTATRLSNPVDEVITYEEVDKVNLAQCLANHCAKKANNGICEPECNYPICGYDGLDCSAGLDPFSSCPRKDYCPHVFKDGKCDEICNVESCLFDGLDCLDKNDLTCNPLYETYCIRHLGDGYCDNGCNTRGCNYDGGDCNGLKEKRTVLVGAVALVLTVEPEIFVNQSNVFLMALGKILDVNLNIKLDDQGKPMIYRWNSRDGIESKDPIPLTPPSGNGVSLNGGRKLNIRPNDSPVFSGVFVVLTVDVTKCAQEGRGDCFSKVESVANFLGASRAREALKQELGWDIYSATPEAEKASSAWSRNVWLISIGSLLVLIFFVLLVAERKRKIISKLWNIPSSLVDTRNPLRQLPLCRGSLDKNGKFPTQNLYESDLKKANNAFRLNHIAGNIQNSRYNQSCTHLDDYINSCPRDLDQYSESGTYSTYAADSDASSLHQPNKRFKPSTTEASGFCTASVKNEPQTVEEWSQEHKNIAAGFISPGILTSAINAKGPDNQTAAMIAVCANRDTEESLKILEQFISNGADLNVQTKTNGETALILGIRCCRVKAVKLMLRGGGDPNVADSYGNTALHHAVNVISAELVATILRDSRRPVDIEAKNDDGCTPLILAAKVASRTVAVLESLLLYKASTCAQDSEGKTALHWSAFQNDVEAINCLLNHGANKDAADHNDQTPLSLAVREGHFEATRVLLERGASKDMVDSMERSPLQIAEERGYTEIAQLLKKFQFSAISAGKFNAADVLTHGSLTMRHHSNGGHKPRPPKRTKSLKETTGSGRKAPPPPPPRPVPVVLSSSLDCDDDDLDDSPPPNDHDSPPIRKMGRQRAQKQQQSKGGGANRRKNGSVSGNSPLSTGSSYASSGVPSVEHVSSFDGSPALSMESPPFFGGTPSPASAWCPPAMYTISCQFPPNSANPPLAGTPAPPVTQTHQNNINNMNMMNNNANIPPQSIISAGGNWYPTNPTVLTTNQNAWYHPAVGYTHYTTPKEGLAPYEYVDFKNKQCGFASPTDGVYYAE